MGTKTIRDIRNLQKFTNKSAQIKGVWKKYRRWSECLKSGFDTGGVRNRNVG